MGTLWGAIVFALVFGWKSSGRMLARVAAEGFEANGVRVTLVSPSVRLLPPGVDAQAADVAFPGGGLRIEDVSVSLAPTSLLSGRLGVACSGDVCGGQVGATIASGAWFDCDAFRLNYEANGLDIAAFPGVPSFLKLTGSVASEGTLSGRRDGSGLSGAGDLRVAGIGAILPMPVLKDGTIRDGNLSGAWKVGDETVTLADIRLALNGLSAELGGDVRLDAKRPEVSPVRLKGAWTADAKAVNANVVGKKVMNDLARHRKVPLTVSGTVSRPLVKGF